MSTSYVYEPNKNIKKLNDFKANKLKKLEEILNAVTHGTSQALQPSSPHSYKYAA